MPNKKYKIGVIGLGARGECFARQLYAGTSRAELFGLCDIDSDRMDTFCDYCELKDARKFLDPEEFMASKGMDAVIITTPDFCHLEPALLAFKAGKHVYLDKPLEVSSERCRKIIRAHRESGVRAFVGFNLRASRERMKIKEIVSSGVLGRIVHVEGLEQLSQAHGASFMRRFHRKKAQSGGLLNTKCSHDMDIMQWYVGHENKVRKVCSFGGVSVFNPRKAPATHCHACPAETHDKCPYRDQAGFVFPVGNGKPLHKTRQLDVYGGDLCVYNKEKELIDNQTVIMEWDNGVRGNFNLQMFQREGGRETKIWGEKGLLVSGGDRVLRLRMSDTGETITYDFPAVVGGHGGTDPEMISRFIAAIESVSPGDSTLRHGLAATLLAEKANESMESGKVVEISPEEYDA